MYKAVVLFCACAVFQNIAAQCIGTGYIPPAPLPTPYESAWNVPCGNGLGPASLAASNGRGLAVTSVSPIAPTGVSMTSENAYEGSLSVTGAVPFLGAVALEGALPTVGEGEVIYGCGNGKVAMISEDTAPGYGYSGYGYPGNYGYPGCGCAGARY